VVKRFGGKDRKYNSRWCDRDLPADARTLSCALLQLSARSCGDHSGTRQYLPSLLIY